jgi:hypothetical protein
LCLIVLCDKATSVIRLFIPLTGHRLDFPAMTNVVEFGMDALKGSLFKSVYLTPTSPRELTT